MMASITSRLASMGRFYLLILTFAGMFATMAFATGNAPSTAVSSSLCSIITTIQTVVGVIALALFILGGAMYAIAHMLPAAGNLRGNLQGWSLGMIVGGIVGLIIVLIAPGLINVIINAAGTTSVSNISGVC